MKKLPLLLYILLLFPACSFDTGTGSGNDSEGYEWTRTFKQTGTTVSVASAIDNSGNIYSAGYYFGTLDLVENEWGRPISKTAGNNDIILTKADKYGTLLWAKAIKNSGDFVDIEVGPDGDLFITGSYSGGALVFPADDWGSGYSFPYNGLNQDIFISKISISGQHLWTRIFYSNGGGVDKPRGITVDNEGNVIVTGYYTGFPLESSDFPELNLPSPGGQDIFIIKISGHGDYLWARHMGSTGNDYGVDVGVGHDNTINLCAVYIGTLNYTYGSSFSKTSQGGTSDVLIMKFNPSGDHMWAKSIGCTTYARSLSIAVNSHSQCYISGNYSTTDLTFPANDWGIVPSKPSGLGADAFILKIDSQGNYIWAKTINAINNQNIESIAVAGNDNLYIAGYFITDPGESVNFAADWEGNDIHNGIQLAGEYSLYITKIDRYGSYGWTREILSYGATSGDNERVASIAAGPDGDIVVTSSFDTTTTNFGKDWGQSDIKTTANQDQFILKFKDY